MARPGGRGTAPAAQSATGASAARHMTCELRARSCGATAARRQRSPTGEPLGLLPPHHNTRYSRTYARARAPVSLPRLSARNDPARIPGRSLAGGRRPSVRVSAGVGGDAKRIKHVYVTNVACSLRY